MRVTFAAPALISDNRIENLNGFPSIGRGYNMFSNTLQSTCFSVIEKNTPTFNLNYEMHEINGRDDVEQLLVNRQNSSPHALPVLRDLLHEQERIGSQSADSGSRSKQILLMVEIDTYYHYLNESESTISETASRLIESQQFVTFFNSCGYYYVRGLGSYSAYIALIQYQVPDENGKEDQAFTQRLTSELTSFHGSESTSEEFLESAYDRRLQIMIRAVGLNKGSSVNLIPLDIQSFKDTVRDAATAMQQSNAGVINKMEVVPWLEHPEFNLAMLHSIQTEGGEGASDQALQQAGDQFMKQRYLELNTGVVTEINRINDKQMENYQFANVCKQHVQEYYQAEGSDPEALESVRFLSKRGNHYISLQEFKEFFEVYRPESILAENIRYLQGDKEKSFLGSRNCIQELYESGLANVDFRGIRSCQQAIGYQPLQHPIIQQYCLPRTTIRTELKHTDMAPMLRVVNKPTLPEEYDFPEVTEEDKFAVTTTRAVKIRNVFGWDNLDPGYYVRVISYQISNLAPANKFFTEMLIDGFDVRLIESHEGNGFFTIISLDPYPTREEAEEIQQQIKEFFVEQKINPFVFIRRK